MGKVISDSNFILSFSSFFRKFLFSWGGFVFFIALILFYLFLKATLAYRQRVKLHPHANKNKFLLYISRLCVAFFHFLKNLPLLLLLLIALLFADKIVLLATSYTKILENNQRIEELTLVAKNLSQIQRVAKIQIEKIWEQNGKPFFEITYYGLQADGSPFFSERYTFEGEQLWIDSIVFNFDYMYIEQGIVKNIALPYCLYSERVAPKDGIFIQNFYDNEGVPNQFRLNDEHIVGIAPKQFNRRLESIFKDKKSLQEVGLRSLTGNAIHLYVKQGESYLLKSLATGGLSIAAEEF